MEHEFLKEYKQRAKAYPYPPTYVTTDAVVVKAGHVLVIRRKMNPGKGLYALPGGFLEQKESIFDSCLRELKEETKIDVGKTELKKAHVEDRVFDHPNRDLRGRTITHAFYFKLDDKHDGSLPHVKGSDDADLAVWLPFNEIEDNESKFYSDHFHIIKHFISRSK